MNAWALSAGLLLLVAGLGPTLRLATPARLPVAALALGAAAGGALVVLLVGPAGLPVGVIVGATAGAVQRRRAATKAQEVADAALARHLPDALELLAAAADGGAPLTRAVAAVALHLPDPLSSALARAARSAGSPAGPTLAQAIRGEGPALRGLAGLVGSSEELGTPVASALRTLAHDERGRVRRQARERAAAAAPKLMLVVGTMLAPAALLLIVVGEALSLLGSLTGGAP